MSREAVQEAIRSAHTRRDCDTLRIIGVVGVCMSEGGATWSHAGILYRWKREVRFFELQSHRLLCDEPFDPLKEGSKRKIVVWIEPKIPKERAQLVAAKCKLIIESHKNNTVPYGFRYARTMFDERGILRLGAGEVGLTCATIVDAIFASVQVPLLDPNEWPPPDEVDKRQRRGFVTYLRRKDPEHADILESEIEAPRISPEEVVAAAANCPTIGTFLTLCEGAAEVSGRLGF